MCFSQESSSPCKQGMEMEDCGEGGLGFRLGFLLWGPASLSDGDIMFSLCKSTEGPVRFQGWSHASHSSAVWVIGCGRRGHRQSSAEYGETMVRATNPGVAPLQRYFELKNNFRCWSFLCLYECLFSSFVSLLPSPLFSYASIPLLLPTSK